MQLPSHLEHLNFATPIRQLALDYIQYAISECRDEPAVPRSLEFLVHTLRNVLHKALIDRYGPKRILVTLLVPPGNNRRSLLTFAKCLEMWLQDNGDSGPPGRGYDMRRLRFGLEHELRLINRPCIPIFIHSLAFTRTTLFVKFHAHRIEP